MRIWKVKNPDAQSSVPDGVSLEEAEECVVNVCLSCLRQRQFVETLQRRTVRNQWTLLEIEHGNVYSMSYQDYIALLSLLSRARQLVFYHRITLSIETVFITKVISS